MKFFGLICLVALLFCLYRAEANATTLEVYAYHIPPYEIVENEKISGFSQLVFNQLLESTEYDVHYNKINWARAIHQLGCEPNAVMLALSRLPERESQYHWIGKIGQLSYYLWGKKEREEELKISHINDIANYTLSVVRGFGFQQYLESLNYFPSENLQLTNSKQSTINMLLKDRVDLVVGDQLILQQQFKSFGLDFSAVTPVYQISNTPNDLYIAVSKSTPISVVENLKKAFQRIKQSGQLKKMYQQWATENRITKHRGFSINLDAVTDS